MYLNQHGLKLTYGSPSTSIVTFYTYVLGPYINIWGLEFITIFVPSWVASKISYASLAS